MSHIDPESLALLAMGEPVATARDSDHLSHCAVCVDELTALRHAALAGRATFDVGDLESPPDIVWTRVLHELELTDPRAVADEPVDPAATQTVPSEMVAKSALAPTASPVVNARRRSRRVGWILAASIMLVAGVGLGAWALGQQPSQSEVAQASLTPFPEHAGAAGSAVVEEEGDGSMVVRVELTADAAPNTFREVWLITADASALVSLGVLDGTQATFPIPADVDLREYVLVDISQEPDDGNAGHSGDSIVRGELAFL